MKSVLRLSLFAALFGFAAAAHGQVTYTSLGSAGSTVVQTFSGLTSVTNMTWDVRNTTGSAETATFNAYIGQWNASTGNLMGTLTAFGATNLSTGSIGAGGITQLTFNGSATGLTSGLTYGLVLSYSGGTSGAFSTISSANPGDAFFGSGGTVIAATSSTSGSFVSSLQGLSTAPNTLQAFSGSFTADAQTFSFNGLAATPEPQTAAAIFAAVFVAGLVGRRTWQRRQLAAAPLAA